MKYAKLLLAPLVAIFWLIAKYRRWFHNKHTQRFAPKIPTIGVGNLSMGGTGKTPLTDYIVHYLMLEGLRVGYLSRGYNRLVSGLQKVEQKSQASQVGDEALQTKLRNPGATVLVCENRQKGLKAFEIEKVDAIIMDDGFQHLRVKAHHFILTTTFHTPYYKDWVFPAGMLREPIAAKQEANAVVVTKCPQNLKEFDAQKIKARLKFSGSVFFTSIHYGSYLEPVFAGATIALEKLADYKLILITGIAQPKSFVNFMSEKSEILKHFAFVDHYHFKEKDLLKIADFCSNHKNENVLVVTTQKDAVRLTTHSQKQHIQNLPIYYIPIELQFLFNQEIEFQKLIKQYAKPD